MDLESVYDSLERGTISTLILGDPSIRFDLLNLLSGRGSIIYLDLSSFVSHLSVQGYASAEGIVALNPGREGLNGAVAEICSISDELEALIFDSLPAFYYMNPYNIGERNRILGVYLLLLKKLAKSSNAKLIVYTFPKPYGGIVGGKLIERLSDTIVSLKKKEGVISATYVKGR